MAETDAWTLLVIVLLAGLTVLTRSFFFLSDRPWTLPPWAQRGLQYAPIAALGGVVIPEVLLTQGVLIDTWRDPRLFAVLAGGVWFAWRRDVLGTIVVGMLAYLPLRLGLGWGL